MDCGCWADTAVGGLTVSTLDAELMRIWSTFVKVYRMVKPQALFRGAFNMPVDELTPGPE